MTPPASRLLITGASGFIGRHLLRELMDRHRIFAVARGHADEAAAPTHRNIDWLRADLSVRADALGLLERVRAAGGIDLVIHLAAYYDFTGEDAPEYRRTNVEGLRNLLDISRRLRPRRFVFSSSVAACDFTTPGQAITEANPADGQSFYARSKRVGEGLLREYYDSFPCCIVRFAALFSDWCEYEPLYVFLSEWLSPGWRSRVLAGRGESAIPYLHIRDAMSFFGRLLPQLDALDQIETLTASTDGASSHRELFAVATACHFGQRRRPFLVPQLVCRMGLRGMDTMGRVVGHRPFERPWMAHYIDLKLNVDAKRTRARLGWAPAERLGILRRMPFLIQNRKTYPEEWLKRNHVAPRRVRLRVSAQIQSLLAAGEEAVRRQFARILREPVNRARFSRYLDCSPTHLDERHHLILSQLICAIRTGDKGVFMNCCQGLAERWHEQGLPLVELREALDELSRVCVAVLRTSPEANGLDQALYDHITMAFQFGIDAVHEVEENQPLGPV